MTWPFSDRLATSSPLTDLSSFSDHLRREAPHLLPTGTGAVSSNLGVDPGLGYEPEKSQ